MDVRIRLLPDISAPLRHGDEVKYFIGTSETIARVRLLGVEVLNPGKSGWLQLELRNPVVAVRGDRYILRRPSPGETLGGGNVVDPQPERRHKRFDQTVLNALESMARGSPVDVLLQTSLALGPAVAEDIITRSRLDDSAASGAIEQLVASGQLVRLDDLLIAASQWNTMHDSVLAVVDAFHKINPLRRGMSREELKSRLKFSPRLFSALMKKLTSANDLVEIGALVTLPGFEIHFSIEQQRAIQGLLARFTAMPFGPPSIKDCQAEIGEDVFAALVDTGDLIAVSSEVVFRRQDYETMLHMIRQAIEQKEKVTLAEVRDLLNTSRRYVQALLEHLDAVGITLRDGDFRRLGK
jgi:selenocysteine-specific elongation factor